MHPTSGGRFFPEGGEFFRSDLLANGDGTYGLAPRLGQKPDRFEPLSLYLAGLLPPSDVPPISVFSSIDISDPSRVVVEVERTVPIEEIVQRQGPRSPSSLIAPKNLRIGTVIISNRPFSEAEYTFITLALRDFDSDQAYDGRGGPSWHWATQGLGSVDLLLPGMSVDAPVPVPAPPTTQVVRLVGGENLLGWVGPPISVGELQELLGPDVVDIRTWSGALGDYQSLLASAQTVITPGTGLSVLLRPGVEVGIELPTLSDGVPVAFDAGLNLVAWTGSGGVGAGLALEGLACTIRTLFVGELGSAGYGAFGWEMPFDQEPTLSTGDPIWIFADAPGTWDQSAGPVEILSLTPIDRQERAALDSELDALMAFFDVTFDLPAPGFVFVHSDDPEPILEQYLNYFAFADPARIEFWTDWWRGGTRSTSVGGAAIFSTLPATYTAWGGVNSYVAILRGAQRIACAFCTDDDGVWTIGPAWLQRGLGWVLPARFVLARDARPLNLASWRTKSEAAPPLSVLEASEQASDVPDQTAVVALGALAVHDLFGTAGDQSLATYWTLIGAGQSWEAAFQEAFGTSIGDFYSHFANIRANEFRIIEGEDDDTDMPEDDEVDLETVSGPAIFGIVRRANGDPVSGATVLVCPVDGQCVQRTTSDSGAFVVPLSPGQ